MSWSDPARRFEPAEDVQLRGELSDLLGFEAASVKPVPGPELAVLAEELRKEALRRRRLERRRPSWGLMAAAVLPLAAAVTGLGIWGHSNGVKADAARALAAQVAEKQQEIDRLAQVHRLELARERATREQLTNALAKVTPKGQKQPYLVIPVDPVKAPQPEQLQVGARQ